MIRAHGHAAGVSAGRLRRALLLAALPCLAGAALADAAQAGAAQAGDDVPPVPGPHVFAACLERIGGSARAAGVSETVVERVLNPLTPDPRVLVYDRRQPEFTSTFADYLNRRVSQARISRGRELLAEHRDLLRRVQADTGVPAHYLVAFWGLETNFGSYFGSMDIPRSLATLACDDRRSSFFTRELVAALQIVDSGDVAADAMRGSWAGAMGHVQFMPSVYLRHARDGDGDGRRDLWGSIPDAMTSAGSFLADLGWQRGTRWGREVRLPEDFDHLLANGAAPRPLAEWVALGITGADGQRLPELDLPARLLLPAGHRGPAFLAYANFEVIMGWNRSVAYAIAVGHLADRIAGAGGLRRPPPEDDLRLRRAQVVALQEALNARGFDVGDADGFIGPRTRAGLAALQRRRGLIADGHPDPQVLEALGLPVSAGRAGTPPAH